MNFGGIGIGSTGYRVVEDRRNTSMTANNVGGDGFLFRSIDESNLSSSIRFIWSQHRMNNLSVNNGGIGMSELNGEVILLMYLMWFVLVVE